MSEKSLATQKNNEDVSVAEVTVVSDESVDSTYQESSEEIEHISKSVVVGRKEAYYENGRNVISVIINAISVRINMPRGTVKALMAILAVIIIAAFIYAANVFHTWNKDSETDRTETETTEDAEKTVSSVLPARDITISENYSYTVPAGFAVEEPELEGSWFSNAKAYGFYTDDGSYCRVRSYIAAKTDGEIRDTVLARLKTAYDVEDIRHEYMDTDLGKVVVYSFDMVQEGEPIVHAVEYSWADDDGTICSLEVSSESDNLQEIARSIFATVHRAENDYTNKELLEINTNYLAISSNYRYHLPDGTFNVDGPYYDYFANEYWCDFNYNRTHYAVRSYAILDAGSGKLQEEVHSMLSADEYVEIIKEKRVPTDFGDALRVEYDTEDREGVQLKVTGYYWYDTDPTICCLEVCNDAERSTEVEEMLLKLIYKKPSDNTQPYPDGYVYEPDVDEAMRSEIEDAWRKYNEPEPDPYDSRTLKP